MSREKPLIVVLLSFFFKSPTRESHSGWLRWQSTASIARLCPSLVAYICTYTAATYSVLMLTKQDSLLIIISQLRGSLIISRLSSRTKACFDWIDDLGSKQSESSIMLWPRQTCRFWISASLPLPAMSSGHPPPWRCLLTSYMIWIISIIIRKIGYERCG